MRTQITNYVRAGYPGIYLVSHEEARVEAELKAVAKALKYKLHAWSATQGLVDTSTGSVKDANDPLEAITAISELGEQVLVLLRDFHLFLDAATGLTSTEAENAYALAVIESKKVDPKIVAREKASTVKKNGVLEIVQVRETLASIGGLDVLKNWLVQRKDAFSQRAREYGLPCPKGLLIVGIPGTGKSLTAKATASILGRPLLKLDAGRLFGGLVGQSEGNLRAALGTAEAIAPCVLWIDEIEKGFSGSKSSGSTDGGTSARVFGGFISWMQERTKPVFVVATANDVTALPPEFMRKGR